MIDVRLIDIFIHERLKQKRKRALPRQGPKLTFFTGSDANEVISQYLLLMDKQKLPNN